MFPIMNSIFPHFQYKVLRKNGQKLSFKGQETEQFMAMMWYGRNMSSSVNLAMSNDALVLYHRITIDWIG